MKRIIKCRACGFTTETTDITSGIYQCPNCKQTMWG